MAGEAYIDVRSVEKAFGQSHLYVVMHFSNGKEWSARAGAAVHEAGTKQALSNVITGDDKTYSPIIANFDLYDIDHPDWPHPEIEPEHRRVKVWSGSDEELYQKGLQFQKVTDEITAAKIEYSPVFNNSNTTVNLLLKSADIEPKQPLDNQGKEVKAPAFSHDRLYQNIGALGHTSGFSFDGKTWRNEQNQEIESPAKGLEFVPTLKTSEPSKEKELTPVSTKNITKDSSIDDMFDALYTATMSNDRNATQAVTNAYLQSQDGQAFLAVGQEFNQQVKAQEQQAALDAQQALAQQAEVAAPVHQGSVMRM